MKIILGLLVVSILTGISTISSADSIPPKTPFDSLSWKATSKEKPSDGIKMGSLRVQFEEITLDDIRQAASAGEISHHGDAGESIYWLCYTNLSSSRAERIWVISHGEMGGSEHSVTGVSAQILPNVKATKDCPALPANLKPVSLDNDLWLNSAASVVLKKLGAPSYKKEPWRVYDFEGKLPGNCDAEGFDLSNWLMVRVGKGRVTSLHAGQVTSC